VRVLVVGDPERLPADARTNYDIARRMGLALLPFATDADRAAHAAVLHSAGVVIDALLGTGFGGAVRSPTAEVIAAINALSAAHVVAIDVPSGLDCDTGRPADPTIRAALTVTFVAPKVGFAQPGVAAYTGRVVVVDIGAPAALLREIAARPSAGLPGPQGA
jgi:NAD(P)H-hydrate epimerase